MSAIFRSFSSFFWQRLFFVAGVFVMVFLSLAAPASATTSADWTINSQINYQAKLLDSSGLPVPDGTYAMKFSLYDQATLGTTLWTAKGTIGAAADLSVNVVNGLFTVALGDTSVAGGSQNPLDHLINWNSSRLYLGVTVGSDSEMTPRKRLTAAPQAFNSQMLQGMYASGTAFGSNALFTVHQTNGSAASGTRVALRVISQGTSGQNDRLMDMVNSSGTTAVAVSRTGRITSAGGFDTTASSTDPVISAINSGSASVGNTWGFQTNRMLVSAGTSTGTQDYAMVIGYNGSSISGLCLDDYATTPLAQCPSVPGTSIQADGTINSASFDLAERYAISGTVVPGDVLVIDTTEQRTVKRSSGMIYDRHLVGVASTDPGFLLGRDGGVSMALAGRVPTKVSLQNGPIAVGDPLTSSPYPGMAMKATKPGMIVGYALEAASATGTIEVFIKVGFDGGSLIQTNGSESLLTDNLVVNARSSATADQSTVNSWGLTFRGSRWDGSQALNQDLILFQDALSPTNAALSLKAGTTTIWNVDQHGTSRLAGDFIVGGKIFPATRSGMQTDKYIFLDDQGGASSTYVATNADGWQANDSYDFAERYYSPDPLQPGDLVVISQRGQLHVQRSLDEKQMLLGIVSTKPAFVAGAPGPSTYPIALAGRVPTHVSTVKGKIQVGDLLAPSTMPGVAVKATQAGPVVGQALEAFDASGIGSIEVFVNPIWWGGPEVKLTDAPKVDMGTVQTVVQDGGTSYRGLARIIAGGQRVHVVFPSLNAYPLVQVTPQGDVGDGWWTDNYAQDSFDIILRNSVAHPVTFSWRVEPTDVQNNRMFLSDGTIAPFNRMTGQLNDPRQDAPVEPVQPVTPVVASTSTPFVDTGTTTGSSSSTTTETMTTTTESVPTTDSTPSPSTTTTESSSSPSGTDSATTETPIPTTISDSSSSPIVETPAPAPTTETPPVSSETAASS